MFAIVFDLVIADVEASYSRHISQAYADIGRTLRRFGFLAIRRSVYLCDGEDLANLSSALKALPWFPISVRDSRAFGVQQWSDFTGVMKAAT